MTWTGDPDLRDEFDRHTVQAERDAVVRSLALAEDCPDRAGYVDEQRDLQEEAYWRRFCQPCGDSPCSWDGTPDGFHTDEPEAE